MKPIDISELYKRLLKRYGAQGWWPANNAFEVVVGAFLVQHTNWRNAEKAIQNLRDARLLDLDALYAARQQDVETLIRPAGFPEQKAERIINFSKHVKEKHSDLNCLLGRPKEELREELLELKGVGPETADVIILYAAGKPAFPVSVYTRRTLGRLAKGKVDYYELKHFVESILQQAEFQKELHALLIQHGKRHCHPEPECDECPLLDMCAFAEHNLKMSRVRDP